MPINKTNQHLKIYQLLKLLKSCKRNKYKSTNSAKAIPLIDIQCLRESNFITQINVQNAMLS